MTAELEPDNSVTVYVKKHKVIVIGESLIHIHHPKTCKKPCPLSDEIKQYLEDELFVKAGQHGSADVYDK